MYTNQRGTTNANMASIPFSSSFSFSSLLCLLSKLLLFACKEVGEVGEVIEVIDVAGRSDCCLFRSFMAKTVVVVSFDDPMIIFVPSKFLFCKEPPLLLLLLLGRNDLLLVEAKFGICNCN